MELPVTERFRLTGLHIDANVLISAYSISDISDNKKTSNPPGRSHTARVNNRLRRPAGVV